MNATPKKKLCWNCEGRVSLSEENCPYCAVYLGLPPGENGEKDLLAPPYRLVEVEESEPNPPPSPYPVEDRSKDEGNPVQSKGELKQVILPLGLLSAGSLFFLFGLILLLFSHEGSFTLSWNADYWSFYLLFALPLLFFGWRTLDTVQKVRSDDLCD